MHGEEKFIMGNKNKKVVENDSKYIFSFLYEYSHYYSYIMSMYFFSALIPDGVGNVCIAFVCLGLLTAVAWVLFPIVLVRIPI